MCGLVGVIGNINQNERKMFKWLLHLDAVQRGEDSTGIIHIPINGEVDYDKEIGPPYILFTRSRKTWLDNRDGVKGLAKMLIGHNRKATVGKVTKENAHPFDFKNVIGVHNGTLTANDVEEMGNPGGYAVDSQAIYHKINKQGDKGVDELPGAWALVWYDKQNQHLKMVRNHQRPLFICRNMRGDCMFWASERWMLEVASSSSLGNVALEKDMYGNNCIGSLLPHQLYTFSATAANYKLESKIEVKKKTVSNLHYGLYTKMGGWYY